jgi:hypothetical protein
MVMVVTVPVAAPPKCHAGASVVVTSGGVPIVIGRAAIIRATVINTAATPTTMPVVTVVIPVVMVMSLRRGTKRQCSRGNTCNSQQSDWFHKDISFL